MEKEIKEDDYWKRPTAIEKVSDNISYYLFVDENNTASYIDVIENLLKSNKTVDENRRFFTVTSTLFYKKDYAKAKKSVISLKQKYWPENNDNFPEICFHSREIRRKTGPFDFKNENIYTSFLGDLSQTLDEVKCKIVSVTFDLLNCYLERLDKDIYSYAAELIIERFLYETRAADKGVILLESRGKKEDKTVLENLKKLFFDTGTHNVGRYEFQDRIKGVYFVPKRKSDNNTYVGLEITDLFSYPLYRYGAFGEKSRTFEIVIKKVRGYDKALKRGLIKIPK